MDFAVTALLAAMLVPDPVAGQAMAGQPVPLTTVDGRTCLPGETDICLTLAVDEEDGTAAFRIAVRENDDYVDISMDDPDLLAETERAQHASCRVAEGETPEIWPYILPVPSGDNQGKAYFAGMLLKRSVGYSGGGADVSRLCLSFIGFAPHAFVVRHEIANLPWRSSLLIRACFDDEDRQKRLGACHDEYDYGASLMLVPDDDGGPLPAIVYRAQATAYPQTARRGEDSSAAPPLKPSDLSPWRDPECSYTRTLRLNPATERYEMDRPAPDCQAYTAP